MAQVSIRFVSPGTRSYTVGNDVVGGVMKMEAIGAGGAGGTATVNSGGGGKGGAYARRNAQAVVSGQALTIVVPPAATTTAGAVATVGVVGGQTIYSVPTYTFTYNASTAGTTSGSAPTGFAFYLIGNPSFKSGAQVTNSTSEPVVMPSGISNGDIAVFLIITNNPDDRFLLLNDGYTLEDSQTVNTVLNNFAYVFTKILTTQDSGKSYDFSDGGGAVAVYSGAASIQYQNKQVSTAGTSCVTPSFSAGQNGLAVLVTAVYTDNGSATNAVAPPTGVTERVTNPPVIGGARTTFSINDAIPSSSTGTSTVFLSARGGAVGGNGSATAGGAGATAQNGTFVGDVEFLGGNGTNGNLTAGGNGGGGAGDASNTTGRGPNTQFGVSRGLGGASAGAGAAFGGAGGGATTLAARGAGAQGIVVLTYSTGTGKISHSAVFNRKLTLFRRGIAAITSLAVFSRKVTLSRMAVATITHVSRALKTIRLRKTASATHVAAYTRKALRLRKTASITHVARIRRALRLLRTASITHLAVFKRLVTLRRRFVASITLRARMLVKLEARLIPREGGGGTVTNVFRNLFLFDD